MLSIGVGRGYFEHELTRYGVTVTVTGTDIADNRVHKDFEFILGNLDAIPEERDFDTIVFVESLEHIYEEEFERNWPKLVNILRRTNGVLIIVNWLDFHPIYPDGSEDHVRLIDDALYDRLSSFAKTVRMRNGSHLVLDF